MVATTLPGRVIAEAVRYSRKHGQGPERRGYLQVDSGVTVNSEDQVTHIMGRPLEPDRTYEVALPRNLLAGFCEIRPLMDQAAADPAVAAASTCDNFVPALNMVVSNFALEIWAGLGALVELDKDGSGSVDRSELAAALRRRLGEEPSEVMLDNLMAAADSNRDGKVDAEELAAVNAKASL